MALDHVQGRSGLDLCCSHGLLGQQLANRGGYVMAGIDSDFKAVDLAQIYVDMPVYQIRVDRNNLDKIRNTLYVRDITFIVARRCLPELFGDDLEPAHFQSLCYEKEALYRSMYQPHLKEIDGAVAFLKVLKSKQIKTALATMGNQLNIDFSLDGLGIRHCFDVVCGGDDVKKGKPHPEIFHLAAERLQLNSENCIVVEDSAGGIAAGLNAGMKVVGITTTHSRQDLLQMGCHQVIDNYVNVDWEQWLD
jgi:HAD superfamily hydrolase (TIGR01509 family)